MTAPHFKIEALEGRHSRNDFDCGNAALDAYFKTQVTQDVRRHLTSCFVAVEREKPSVAGFYTLAASGIALDSLPPSTAKKLPRYPTVPAALIGRLAVHVRNQGSGLGSALIVDAIKRSSQSDMAVFAIFADAIDDSARRFYERMGFHSLISMPNRLYLPMSVALKQVN